MKPAHLLSFAGALLGVFALPATAATKNGTYTVDGYFRREKPSADLVEKAAAEVGGRMKGMAQTDDIESADHRVEILFEKDSFHIYVDALPLASAYKIDRLAEMHRVFRGDAMEQAESARAEASRSNK